MILLLKISIMLTNSQYQKEWVSSEILTTIIKEMIYGGYFIALLGPSLVIATSIITGANLSVPLLIISYLIPLMVYSFDYYRDMDKDKSNNQDRVEHLYQKKKVYPYILLCYISILALLLLFFTNWMMISYILFLVLVGFVYSFGVKRLTKKVAAFKNIYTVFIWSLAGSFSVAFFYGFTPNLIYMLIFLAIFLKMLPNAIFFDLKDIKSDAKEGLKTIPVLIGKAETLKLLESMNILAFVPLFIGIYLGIIPIFTSILIVFVFYSLYYLRKIRTIKDDKMKIDYNILADAEFILWPVVLFIGEILFLNLHI